MSDDERLEERWRSPHLRWGQVPRTEIETFWVKARRGFGECCSPRARMEAVVRECDRRRGADAGIFEPRRAVVIKERGGDGGCDLSSSFADKHRW